MTTDHCTGAMCQSPSTMDNFWVCCMLPCMSTLKLKVCILCFSSKLHHECSVRTNVPILRFQSTLFSDLVYPFVMIEDLDWSCLLLVQPTQTYFYHISINQTIKIGPVITMVGLNLDEFMFMELSSKEMHS